jgi:hypothetical protein
MQQEVVLKEKKRREAEIKERLERKKVRRIKFLKNEQLTEEEQSLSDFTEEEWNSLSEQERF